LGDGWVDAFQAQQADGGVPRLDAVVDDQDAEP
jgi:hypothetical protein